jgi:ankyrin repeat protein
MLYDAYVNTTIVHSNVQLERLQRIGKESGRYLLEALHNIQKATLSLMDEDMTHICGYIWRSYPSIYVNEVYPRVRWPIVDQLLQVFSTEFDFLAPKGIIDYRIYQKSLAFATSMQSQFPLADGSSLLHCLMYVVCPDDSYLPMLAAIVVASGCNLTSVRNDGMSAIELAVQFGNNSLVSVLIDTYMALGIDCGVVRRLISCAAEWHHHDVCQTLFQHVVHDEKSQTHTSAPEFLMSALKLAKSERIFTQGKEVFANGQQLLDCLAVYGCCQSFNMDSQKIGVAIKNAVIGGNDDILSYNNWAMLRALSTSVMYKILELAIDLGEATVVEKLLHLSTLDHSSVLQLVKHAFKNGILTNVKIAEIILDYYPIPQDYIIELVESSPPASNLLSKVLHKDPQILFLQFGVHKQTLLHHAVIRGKLETAKLLFNYGAVINARDDNGNTPLHLAVDSSNEACLAWLLGLQSIDVEARNKSGQTSLLYATNIGNLSAVRLLLENHTNVTAVTEEGYTALHLAYSRYCERTFQKLRVIMPDLVAQIEERKAREILSGTLEILKEYGADEEAIEYVMGFNPKSYFSWLLETTEVRESKMIETWIRDS